MKFAVYVSAFGLFLMLGILAATVFVAWLALPLIGIAAALLVVNLHGHR